MIASIIVAITFSIASFFGALAYLIWRIEVLPKNGKNLKNKEYRIKRCYMMMEIRSTTYSGNGNYFGILGEK